MVKLTQDIQAAYEVETSGYGNPPATNLYHLGLLDTFDPRKVEMNITPIPSIGQSTDAHHASGPIDVTLPLKVALQGDGWKELLGNAIGKTDVYGSVDTAHSLTRDTYSHAIIAKDTSTAHHTLCTGVVANEVTLEADYTAGGYMTLEANCTALYTEDADTALFTFNDNDDYRSVEFPTAPTTDPLLPTDLTVSYAAASDADALQLTDTAGKYVEVGERYMRFFLENGNAETEYTTSDDSTSGVFPATGVMDIDHASSETLTEVINVLNAATSPTVAAIGSGAGGYDPQNLLKGIYRMTGSAVNIPCVALTTPTLTAFNNLKTVSLKIANNNTPIPGKTDSIWLQNSGMARGKADITLDITTTAHDETLYDIYRGATAADRVIPLVRLDFGTNGSIALTNGTITSFSRPLTGGSEVTDTISIKFRGNGDFLNYSAFAISTDLTLQ